MPDRLTLAAVDSDGAIQETLDRATSRGGFLKTSAVAGGTLLTAGGLLAGLPKLLLGAPSAAQDAEILNFALTLEYLEAEFYTQAEKSNFDGELGRFAKVVGAHERAHVEFLQGALGSAAVAKPRFDFQGTTEDAEMFAATAQTLEDTGVAAYNGAGPSLTKETLGAAAQIVSVEARHAAWIRDINGANPAPVAFDPLRSRKQILKAVGATGFIQQ